MEKIFVTQPVLPDLDEFVESLKDIWNRKWLTNNGKYHREFEKALADYLGVPYISLFSNGTLALISALQVMNITGEVITTPYSFVATTHALWWNNIKPVFVDIEPEYCNLDPAKIEAAITPQTTAILPVHVYGNPCDDRAIQDIADRYGLKVIYDAAHAFGVKQNEKSILNFGDLSVLSFHATKVFNTIEGGAIVCHDEKTKKRIDYLKNFGFAGETEVIAPGINAKMNEIQAAYGMLQLKTIEENIEARKEIARIYRKKLEGIRGLRLATYNESLQYNNAYFPIFVDEKEFGATRDDLYYKLKANNIFGRRYFYPLISQFPTYRGLDSAKPEKLKVAAKIAEEVICLPIYPDLEEDDVNRICSYLKI
ncbi:DegT/DnrJ/EryC1/StrS family aminotransferase [uncultured Draconibacterium sp.]|uniref:DegT/DnrJ/EryC1/StrS family aminotransferase n=1 Tax=uncultured Draconibacterium sp. TaxID=1573823 RepID=UPI0029C8CB58|nr:DegT/DnrJ/EryC1/StrS family aminotransferase [uncultured Draconibacterium sp.]